ncbi:hypothetical protein L2E82_17427 [Cichorium intybus]|uniref:Uncharacterized protein n=1 Tax=Cichorium intybus TaxID=13427 RepID=A0ACB9F890_CICIN|nr:hypothetical protein L2E82_17427 [Cichorium intybus]
MEIRGARTYPFPVFSSFKMYSTALLPRRAEDNSAARRTLDYKLSVHNEVYLLVHILKVIKELSMTFDVVRVASFQKYHPRPDDLRWYNAYNRIPDSYAGVVALQ